ncbi:MAG TPA: hypothetical protein VLD65_01910 [Anaerolineales bacterium]|nr:hypothetical protein [Anaerolineales bacterium]
MDSILQLIVEILGPLLGDLIGHKTTRKKIQWDRGFRLYGVGFTVVGMIIAFLFIADKDIDPSGAVVCAGPFIFIGVILLVIGILRKNNLWR